MICRQCGAQVNDGVKFCVECGAPVQEQPARPQDGTPIGSNSVHKEKPTARYSSGKTDQQGAQPTIAPKPDFGPQTEYREETFEQGPGPFPNPEDPLPLSDSPASGRPPSGAGGGTDAGASTANSAANRKKSMRGCLFAVIGIAVILLLLSFSCSAMSQCASTMNDQAWMPGQGNGTGGSAVNTGNTTTTSSYTSPAPAAVAGKDTWTVLFYLCGSNLETDSGMATSNLQELASSKLGDKVTFAIETGGAKRWKNSTVSSKYLTRYAVNSQGFYEQQKLPSASMAVESTFADFVKWGVESYPADHYMLVMWDHGGGSVYGVCNDELYPTKGTSIFNMSNDTLTLTEMSNALDQVGVKFDVIGFDTCLMGTFETALKLKPYADYLVASEEVEPGSGWDYVSWPQWLGAHTTATGDQLGAQICDTYYAKCRLYNAANMATLSVVDLSRLDTLADAFLGASREMATVTNDRAALRSLYKASRQAMSFGGESSYNMVDLCDLMRKSSSVAKEYYDDVIAGVDHAVVYQVRGRSRSKAAGLSVFYPLETSYNNEFYDFLDVAGNVPYAQYAAVIFGLYNTVDWSKYASSIAPVKAPVEEEGIDIQFEESVNDKGQLQIQITNGIDDVAKVSAQLSLLMPDQRAIVYLGEGAEASNPKEGVYVDEFYGKWMCIGGQYVSANLLEEGDDFTLYYIPVSLNGENTNLIVRYDRVSGKYEVECADAAMDEGGMSPKQMRSLEEGDKITFQFDAYRIDDEESFVMEMGEVTWSEGTAVEEVDLGEGAYLFRFAITDVLGQQHFTNLYVQDYKNGTITVKQLSDYLKEIGLV